MKAWLLMLTVASLWFQPRISAQQVATGEDAGPTMKETKAWLENDMANLARDFFVERISGSDVRWTNTYLVQLVSFAKCKLTYVDHSEAFRSGNTSGPVVGDLNVTVPMADINAQSITVDEAPKPSYSTYNKQAFVVRFELRSNAASAIAVSDAGSSPDFVDVALHRLPRLVRSASFHVSSAQAGERVRKALTRAAALCGSKPSF
jgi:hypothetical protein